jgi:hypothetical protein
MKRTNTQSQNLWVCHITIEWTIDKWFLSHRWVQYTDGNPGDSSGSSRVKQQNNFWWMADIEPLVKWVLLWDIDQLSYNQCHWDISY